MILDFSQNGLYCIFEIDHENKVSLRHFSTQEKEFERKVPGKEISPAWDKHRAASKPVPTTAQVTAEER